MEDGEYQEQMNAEAEFEQEQEATQDAHDVGVRETKERRGLDKMEQDKRKIRECPVCKGYCMFLADKWESLLGLNYWYQWLCENCSAKLEYKEMKEDGENQDHKT